MEQAITGLPVNNYGLTIPDPMKTTQMNWTALFMATRHLLVDIRGRIDFRSRDHP